MKYKTYAPIAEGFSNNNTRFIFDNKYGDGKTCQQMGLYGWNASITFSAKCTNDGAFSYIVFDMYGVNYVSNITTDTGISTGFGKYVVLEGSEHVYAQGIYSPTLNTSITEWTINLPGAGNYCTSVMPLKYDEESQDCSIKAQFDGVTLPVADKDSAAFRVTPLLFPVFVSIILTFLFAH